MERILGGNARVRKTASRVLVRPSSGSTPRPVAKAGVTFDALEQFGSASRGDRSPGEKALEAHAHRPAPGAERPVIARRLHTQNILMEGGVVTGVIDWPNALVAHPAYDVASTRIILGLVPLELSPLPTIARVLVSAARPLLLALYLAGYRRCRPIDGGTLAYYEAAACMRQLVRIGEQRLTAAAAGRAPGPLDGGSFGDRLCARFARITGIAPVLPTVA